MDPGTIALLLVLAFGAVIVIVLIVSAVMTVKGYNKLVGLRNRFKNAWAQIDVQLQRRYDLIPNMVETAKGFLKHEHDTLTELMEARNKASAAAQQVKQNPDDSVAMGNLVLAEGMLAGAMNNMMRYVDMYPDLKGDKFMQEIMEELKSTENKIAFARQSFNDMVMQYNNERESFPTVTYAGMLGFTPAAYFEVKEEARDAPKVEF